MQYKPKFHSEIRAMRQAIVDMKEEYGEDFIEDMRPQID